MRRPAVQSLLLLVVALGAAPAPAAVAAEPARYDVVRSRAPARAAQDTWPSPPPGRGERRVAVVLMSASADIPRRWDPDETAEAMFGPERSVDRFMRASSGDRVSVGGDVHGWYTADDLGEGCDEDHLARRGLEVLRADGVDLTAYHYVMVHFPRRDCPFNGLAWLSDPLSLINGRPSDVRLLSHELGHNFGLRHANALTCTGAGAPVTWSAQCSHGEYGDPFSTMGHNHNQFHGVERAYLGWMPDDHFVVAERDGVFTLGTQDGDAPEVLSVPLRSTLNWWEAPTHLALDLRGVRAPFDAFAPDDPAVAGVSLRLIQQYERRVVQRPMKLLDATPGSPGGHRDGSLRVGETFVYEPSRTAVTLEALEGGVARVRVGWVPSTPADVTARLDGRDAAVLAWGASEDDRGVEAYELEHDGAVVARTSARQARVGGLAPGREHRFRVVAVDGDGNRRPSPPVTVTTPQAPASAATTPAPSPGAAVEPAILADTTRPTVGHRPALGRRVPRSRRLVVVGRDDRPGVRLRVRVDGRVVATATAGRLVVRLSRRVLRGRHRIELSATDAAGNRRVLRIRVARGVLRPAGRTRG